MSTRKKIGKTDQDRIDELVVAHADDESAWAAPIRVTRPQPVSLSIPGELAARANFLAKLNRER